MKKFFAILAAAVISFSTFQVNAQINVIEGRVSSNGIAVPGAEVVISYKDKNGNHQQVAYTTGKGLYFFKIKKTFPYFASFRVGAKSYTLKRKKDVLLIESRRIQDFTLFDSLSAPTFILGKHKERARQAKDKVRYGIAMLKSLDTRYVSQSTQDSLLIILATKDKALDSLSSAMDSLMTLSSKRGLSVKSLESQVETIETQLKVDATIIFSLNQKIADLVRELDRSLLRVANCYCEAYTDTSITIGFDIVDKNGNLPLDSDETLRLRILKLDNTRKQRRALRYKSTNNEYYEESLHLPYRPRKLITFITKDKEFKNSNANYYVEIINMAFPKSIINLQTEIPELKHDCFNRGAFSLGSSGLPPSYANRKTIEKNSVHVDADVVHVEISDDVDSDGDVVTLILNDANHHQRTSS